MDLKNEITEFILNDLLSGELDQLGPDENLLLAGRLDSLSVMRLVAHFEKRLGRRIPPEAITVTNFRTINDIERFLSGLKG